MVHLEILEHLMKQQRILGWRGHERSPLSVTKKRGAIFPLCTNFSLSLLVFPHVICEGFIL